MNEDYIINLSYDIEYNNHIIFVIEQMSKQYDIIYNIFDDLLIENLVKLYILNKKDKLNEECKLYINIIFELIFNLKSINKLSNIQFLDTILLIIKIQIILPNLIELINNTTYANLLNVEIIKVKFLSLFEELCKNNLLIFNLKRLLNNNSKTNNKEDNMTKEIVETIVKILACEYFRDYNSIEMLKLITTKLYILNDKNNSILVDFIKYKKKFIYEYNELCLKYNDLYLDIKTIIKNDYKYKISNNFFLEMINDLTKIENLN